jgi:uncharacterized protein YecE (DUF72 family)
VKAQAQLVGCAGWSIPREAAASFPPAGSHLERYASVFGAVEINSSFYRPHRPQTYARWAASVPQDFRFSVKLPRTITHELHLHDFAAELERFRIETAELGDKLGCVLVQFPPSLAFDQQVAGEFFSAAREAFGCMLACEARHLGWFTEQATLLFQHHNITRVQADPAIVPPAKFVATSADAYIRLHGSPRMYYSQYSHDFLSEISRTLITQHSSGKRVWCIFDNTAAGAAVPDALILCNSLA